jgi:hypothetical protein
VSATKQTATANLTLSNGITVGDIQPSSDSVTLREPTPALDTLDEIRFAVATDTDVDTIIGELGLGPQWKSVVESIHAGDDRKNTNPIHESEITDEIRAGFLEEYLRTALTEQYDDLLLMPVAQSGKKPEIADRGYSLESAEGTELLYTPQEAITAVENGHRGFGIYCGEQAHNASEIVVADHDDMDIFPLDTLQNTLTVRSGSGKFHEHFFNDGSITKGSSYDGGELRANSEFCFLPGAVHSTGGVYHVSRLREPRTISQTDLPDGLQGSESTSNTSVGDVTVGDISATPSGGYTNLFDVTLDECRERNSKLDELLSQKHPTYLQGSANDTSQSGIDFRLMSMLQYHGFRPRDAIRIWRTHRRGYQTDVKLHRTGYVHDTFRNSAHDKRFTPADYFNPETDDCPEYLASLPEDIDVGPTPDRGEPSITTEEVWDRRDSILRTVINERRSVLFDGIPSTGKSYGIVKVGSEVMECENNDTKFLFATSRHDLYEQYEKWCAEFGMDSRTLPSFHDECDTANGEYGDEWGEQVLDLYNRGVSGKEIHQHATEYFGAPLPCDSGRECPWSVATSIDPEEHDVLIGNYVHAYNTALTEDRIVVFDEFPRDSFVHEFGGSTVANAVSNYCEQNDGFPFADVTDLLERRDDSAVKAQAEQWFSSTGGVRPDSSVVMRSDGNDSSSHAYAPLMTYALLNGVNLENGFEKATLGVDTEVTTVDQRAARRRHDGRLWILDPPDLSDVAGVIALDGTPTKSLWDLTLGEELEHIQLLSDDERRAYFNRPNGRTTVQTTTNRNPYSSGKRVTPEKDGAMFEAIIERMEVNKTPPMISTNDALNQYQDAGVLTKNIQTDYHGNMKGTNEFGTENIGIVSGSAHYGDGYVKRWSALNGESVKADRESNNTYPYTTQFGNDVLRSFRESQTFQANMRFGRDNDSHTVVFSHTNTNPDWFPVEEGGRTIEVSDGMREVLYAIAAIDVEPKFGDTFTTKNVEHRVNVSRRTAAKHLDTLVEFGYLEKERPKNAVKWSINRLPFNPFDSDGMSEATT